MDLVLLSIAVDCTCDDVDNTTPIACNKTTVFVDIYADIVGDNNKIDFDTVPAII